MKLQLSLMLFGAWGIFSCTQKPDVMTISEIKDTITQDYLAGAFNETDLKAFQRAFHPEFAIINIQEDGSFYLFGREAWEAVLRQRLENPDFDYSTVALKADFRQIDHTENEAMVSLDLKRESEVIYTDFLLLKRIKGKWTIVSKIFEQK